MRTYGQNQDGSGNGPFSDFINRVLKRLTELQFYDSTTVKVEQTTRGTRFHALVRPLQGGGGGYQGTYDNTKSYSAGDIVRVLATETISGVVVAIGLYGVPPEVSVPGNGTGYQIPQYPEPTEFSASPNDKVYWHALVLYCDI